MDVNKTIAKFCKLYGVKQAFGERLRPLLERAASSPPEKRDRLIRLVERSFAEEAQRFTPKKPMKSRFTKEEIATLRTVAGILHAWDPPAWLTVWQQHLRGKDSA